MPFLRTAQKCLNIYFLSKGAQLPEPFSCHILDISQSIYIYRILAIDQMDLLKANELRARESSGTDLN